VFWNATVTTPGAFLIVSTEVPLSRTATPLSARSYSPVTCALGAFAFSQARRALRCWASWAWTFLVLSLPRSTRPLARPTWVEVASESPLSWTITLVLSTPVDFVAPPVFGLAAWAGTDAAPARANAPATASVASRRAIRGCCMGLLIEVHG